ncbi:hypothetical protein [Robinsoniella sp. KNHs210]|uniref:hypothetical protein n=1 Tax=Robinsoniella sp. KNHs210 TaxID=1469950 RepID=UPI00048348C0|nr:hypothetical protein [Robinsoniella sp. KNHs210]
MKKVKLMLLFAVICTCLCGCKEQQNQQPETVEEGEHEMSYTKESVELVTNALSCQQKDAESILGSLEMQNIGNLTEANALEASEGYKLQVKDELDNTYILHIDKKYHLYAIQEDNTQGKYIYMEVE